MGAEQGKSKTRQDLKPVQILRERRGGVPKELLQRNREQAQTRKQITTTLKDGPKTVPEIAAATGLASHRLFWCLMGMRKYGQVVEGEERDGYFEYALKPEEERQE